MKNPKIPKDPTKSKIDRVKNNMVSLDTKNLEINSKKIDNIDPVSLNNKYDLFDCSKINEIESEIKEKENINSDISKKGNKLGLSETHKAKLQNIKNRPLSE